MHRIRLPLTAAARTRRLVGLLLLAAALVVGILTMHGQHQAHAAQAAHRDTGIAIAHGQHDAAAGAAEEAGSPAPVAAIALCVLVLLGAVLLVGPRVGAVLRRLPREHDATPAPPASLAPPRPPDLDLLSISRT